MHRNTAALGRFAVIRTFDGADWLERNYVKLFAGLMAAIAASVFVGLALNSQYLKEWNILLMFGWLAVWAFATFHPKVLLALVGLGFLRAFFDGEPETVGHALTAKVRPILEKFIRATSHLANLMVLVHGVFTLIRFTTPWAVFGFLAFAAAAGVATIAFPSQSSGIYRKISWIVIILGLVASGVGATLLRTHPQDITRSRIGDVLRSNLDARRDAAAQAILAKADRGETLSYEEYLALNRLTEERGEHGLLGGVTYEKIVPVRVSRLAPQRVCGIRPGDWRLSIPTAMVVIDGGSFDLASWMRVNGSRTGETVHVPEDGCVVFHFAFGRRDQGRTIQPQRIALRFS